MELFRRRAGSVFFCPYLAGFSDFLLDQLPGYFIISRLPGLRRLCRTPCQDGTPRDQIARLSRKGVLPCRRVSPLSASVSSAPAALRPMSVTAAACGPPVTARA